MIKSTAAQSIQRAAQNYLKKIDWVMEHNPEDIGELACLYAGISGIKECIKALQEDSLITKREEELLNSEMEELYIHCQIK
ncbi:hypothetical protein [Spirochaeta isovalerica]|uniref:Uncharacterized protein n=1 Tax=Spirochaeta isovalerica TaxID=150 RepID=A0A841R8I4_9SPIO|nr:hypothetical protein [Spirochaeta isovalerica]MBB6481594.1 hypothetical protein [Spirochaeta isovalerica]